MKPNRTVHITVGKSPVTAPLMREEQYEFTPPTRICNASSKVPLILGNEWRAIIRPGADHSHIPSLGTGC